MKPFTIAIDTSCDLPPEYIEENRIKVLPIPFILDGVEHKKGYWHEISAKGFYEALRNGGVANTSQINPDSFVKSYTQDIEQGEDALYILLSSALSSTYHNSLVALDEVKSAHPGCNIFTVDSIGAIALVSLLVKLAVKKRDEGLSAAETASLLEEKKHRILGSVIVDDLMYLHRGGRLSKLSAVGGSILGIKPIISILPDGTLALKEKVRGREASLKLMVNQLKRSVSHDKTLDTVFISHSDCADDASKLADMVRETVSVRQVELIPIGPVIGAHVGPGAVALVFEADMTRAEFESKYYSGK